MAENAGDLGAGSAPDGPDLMTTRLESRAIRERWPMSADVRTKVLKRLCKIVDEDAVHEDLPKPTHREVIAAARALIAADSLNLQDRALTLKTEGDGSFNLSEVTAAAEAAAQAHRPAARPEGR